MRKIFRAAFFLLKMNLKWVALSCICTTFIRTKTAQDGATNVIWQAQKPDSKVCAVQKKYQKAPQENSHT